MTTISSALAAAQDTARHSWASGLAAILKCGWVAFSTWRIERAAIVQLPGDQSTGATRHRAYQVQYHGRREASDGMR